jgi:hypothetical protein
MLTVPISTCFSLGANSGLNVFFAAFEGFSTPQIDRPPSLSELPGPIGSPVWKEKFGWTECTGEKL